MNDNQPCGHSPCACSAPAGEKFCSDYCRQAAEHPHAGTHGERCQCGHPSCAASPDTGARTGS